MTHGSLIRASQVVDHGAVRYGGGQLSAVRIGLWVRRVSMPSTISLMSVPEWSTTGRRTRRLDWRDLIPHLRPDPSPSQKWCAVVSPSTPPAGSTHWIPACRNPDRSCSRQHGCSLRRYPGQNCTGCRDTRSNRRLLKRNSIPKEYVCP